MSQINKPNTYFNTVLYSGNGSTQSITGVNFQPDLVWTKSRSNSGYNHQVHDVIRGADKVLWTNLTNVEGTGDTNGFLSFQSDGFNLGADTAYTEVNQSGQTYASWNWLAGGTGVSNTDGSITSTVSANTTSGFSIVSYTGNGSSGATVGHSLGSVPKMIIVKNRESVYDWRVYHQSLGSTKYLNLNTDGGFGTATSIWNDTNPTSSVFSIGDSPRVNESGIGFIAYCFAEKKGFSKFGSYVGNGSADGTFVYTGFKPAMVIVKNTNSVTDWIIKDNKRSTYNVVGEVLYPNGSYAEDASGALLDFTSNGFKLRISGASAPNVNESGSTFIYMCFAENPLVGTNNIPATAR